MKQTWVAAATVALTIGTHSFAGEKAGNGGGAFICSNPAESEFLDLFEAKIPGIVTDNGLQIPTSNGPVEDQIQAAFNRLRPGSALYQAVMGVYAKVRSAKINALPHGVSIAWPADEKNQITETGCTPEGIILFDDADNSMLLDTEAMQSLPSTQQAAAWVHETIYKFLRETQQDTDSIRARAVVGHLFSSESQDVLDAALAKIAHLHPEATGKMVVDPQGRVDYFAGYPGQPMNFSWELALSPGSDAGCVAPTETSVGISSIWEWQNQHSGPYPGLSGSASTPASELWSSKKTFSFYTDDGFTDQSTKSGFLGLGSRHLHCFADLTLTGSSGDSLHFNHDFGDSGLALFVVFFPEENTN